jgi:CRP/FNR family cyclic AMP-dependent transcriptional regulator
MKLPIKFLVSGMPLFDSLDSVEVEEIEKRVVQKNLEQGTVIYKQGTKGLSVCFVVEGELSVIKRGDDGDATISSVEKGQSVGEMAIIDGLTRSADVVAATDATVLILKRVDFESLVAEQPEIAVKVLVSLAKVLSKRIRDRSIDVARMMLD